MNNSFDIIKSITGRYSLVTNPCITKPCLPGMAYAVSENDKYYFITVNDKWFSENRAWGDYTPELDDVVTISGYIKKRKDIFDHPFQTIEAISLTKAT